MKTRGACSWFGGPDDSGVSASEDLAFIYSVDDQPDLFLPQQPPGTTGLARRLDPDEFYVACRWPYNSETKAAWREALLTRKALVINPKNGKRAWAFPADWGPHGETNRVADLSPSLLEFLQLQTDEEVLVYFPTRQVTLPNPPNISLSYPIIVISAGHGLKIRGASGITDATPWGVDEVDEARKIVTAVAEALQLQGVKVYIYFDDISTEQQENLERIVGYHNSIEGRDLDISIHLNAYKSQTTEKMGCEVFAISQRELAADLSAAMAHALDLPDRGFKDGSGLYFCAHTEQPSLLIEAFFCDSKLDCDAYRANFEDLTQDIVDVLTGQTS